MKPIIGVLSSTASSSPEGSSSFLRDYVVWEFNAFCWISIFAATYILSVMVFELFKLWFQARKLPGPPCDGFSGHNQLLSGVNLSDVLSNTHEKYGSVVKLWLSPTALLVSIKDPKLIQEVLLKAEDKLPVARKAFRMAFGRSSLFASSTDKVAERRQLLATEFDQRSPEIVNIFSTKLMSSIVGQLDLVGEGTDCKMVSQLMAFTLLGSLLYGEAFLGWSEGTVYREMLLKIVEDACFCASYRVIPFWKREFWRYRQLCTTLKFLTNDILQRCRKCCEISPSEDEKLHDNKPGGSQIQNPFGLPKQTAGPSVSGGQPVPREELCGNIMNVMFHGFFTAAGLIGNILARVVAQPELQYEIYSEIVASRKSSAKRDEHDVHRMPLLLATIYESVRLQPAGPLLQRRSLKHDLCLKNGIVIPAGSIVVVPVQLVQTDPSSWGSDAAKFNPYRFLSQASSTLNYPPLTGSHKVERETDTEVYGLKDPNENIAFLPFGLGPRSCLGEKFVIRGIANLFASLLECYEVKAQPGSKQKQKPSPAVKNYVFSLPENPDIALVPRTV